MGTLLERFDEHDGVYMENVIIYIYYAHASDHEYHVIRNQINVIRLITPKKINRVINFLFKLLNDFIVSHPITCYNNTSYNWRR